MTTFAVTGATGHFGRLAIAELLERGVPASDIVAIVRTPAKAADLSARGVTVRAADYSEPATLAGALEGVDALLLVSGTELGKRVGQHAAVVDAAKAAGVTRIAYTSVVKADDTQLILAPEHLASEQYVQASGLDHTILRNSWYIENYTDRAGDFLAHGVIVGAARDAHFAPATRADYAAAAAVVLTEDGHAGAVYELGGTPVTMSELATAISEASGTEVVYRDVSSADLQTILTGAGIDEGYAAMLVGFEESTARGELNTDSGDLERLLGRPPTSLADAVKAALSA
jgi:NAD(P)H dehydrogenase (quinone)